MGGQQGGYDGAKKAKGRKRNLLVDTEGLVIKAKLHSAKIPDQEGLKLLLESALHRIPAYSTSGWMPAIKARVRGGPRRPEL